MTNSIETAKQYAERDFIEMDAKGAYYFRHVRAMTAENLHDKSDIAAELGWRDMQIAAQAARIEQLTAESVNEELREAVRASLGEALDCTRVWSAWSYGTMSESDFVQVADDDERVEEIVYAVVEVIKARLQAGEVQP